MSTFLWILAGVAIVGLIWFLALPWVPPLYQRYRAYIQKKASGQ